MHVWCALRSFLLLENQVQWLDAQRKVVLRLPQQLRAVLPRCKPDRLEVRDEVHQDALHLRDRKLATNAAVHT